MANPNFNPSFSSNEVWRDMDNTRCLTDDLDTIEADIASLETAVDDKADSTHTHSEYALLVHEHSGYADYTHTHSDKADLVDGKVPSSQLPAYVDDVLEYTAMANFPTEGESGKIYVDQTTNKTYRWSGSVYVEISASLALGETAATAYRGDYGKVAYDHSQNGDVHVTATQKTTWDSKADLNHTHSEYAPASHEHTGYADEVHTHSEYAPVSHSHSGYASSSHTHSGYADADHSHDEYFSVDGGTINGETNVAGVFRVQGQQAFYYNTSSNSQTIGTNNATGGTTICCGPSATAAINGTYLKTATILPRSTNTYTCGNANFRWSGIYSTAAVNVSSDERMKRDVSELEIESLAKFVDDLNVVSYNYNTDDSDAKARIGLIAQDVCAANPEIAEFFVDTDEEGMLNMRPADLVFPLIAAVQKLSQRVAELEAKLG